MNWPWGRRHFREKLRRCDGDDLRKIILETWPAAKNLRIELGDFEFYMPNRGVSDWLWENIPQIFEIYSKSNFDCENFTRKRLVQMDELLLDWTDLDLPLSICEIRGYPFPRRDEVGHSMLLEIMGDVGARLRQPYSGLKIEEFNFIGDPWLVYQ